MALMNPRLPDGRHAWRDGRFITKSGLSLYIDGTTTLAGSCVAACHRPFVALLTTCALCEPQSHLPRPMRAESRSIHVDPDQQSDPVRDLERRADARRRSGEDKGCAVGRKGRRSGRLGREGVCAEYVDHGCGGLEGRGLKNGRTGVS